MDNVKNENEKMSNKMIGNEAKAKSFNEQKHDELGRIINFDLGEVPENMTEDLMDMTYIVEDDGLPPTRRSSTKPINLRIENDLLVRLQKVADIKKIPYQTLLKQFVAERVYEEEKREKILT